MRLYGETIPTTSPCQIDVTVDGSAFRQVTPSDPLALIEFASLASEPHVLQANVSCPTAADNANTDPSVFSFTYAKIDAGVVNSTVLDDGDSVSGFPPPCASCAGNPYD